MTDNTFTRVDPLMVHDALLYGPHRQDAADYACAALRAAYAEIDRLRASALTWTTVTKDLATLPEKGRPVLIRTGRYYFAGYRNTGKTKCWVINPKESSCDKSHLFVGDRWAYIPEAPDADN